MINKIDLINAFRPSLAKHILTCYKAFEYEYTEEDTPPNEYAEKGIKLHKTAENLYNNSKLKIDNAFTKDDINLVKGYVYYIKSIAKNADIYFWPFAMDFKLKDLEKLEKLLRVIS